MKTFLNYSLAILLSMLSFAFANGKDFNPNQSDNFALSNEATSAKSIYSDITGVYIVGTFNDWNTNDPIELTPRSGFYAATVEVPPGTEFKIITTNSDGDIYWWGGVDGHYVGYFGIFDDLLGQEISLIDGANFLLYTGGVYTFSVFINDTGMNDAGMKLVVTKGELVEKNVGLSVNLPTDVSIDDYKDMFISVKNTETESSYRCLVTNKRVYNFSVPNNSTYDISLVNSMGVHFGDLKNIPVNNDNVDVTFSNLLKPHSVSIAVTLPDNVDITDDVNITWTNLEGVFLGQGAILHGVLEGMQLKYEVKIPSDFAMNYIQPSAQDYTVKAQNNYILLQLQPFGSAKIAGEIRDYDTGLPISLALITASQSLNGKQTRSFTTHTNNKGLFEFEVLEAPTQVIASAQGYLSQTVELQQISDNVRLETFHLKPIAGTIVHTNLTYRPSVQVGQTATMDDYYSDYQNISFTIRNITRNKTITQFQVQYPEIVVLEDVADGDQLEVTAHSIKGNFNDVSATGIVNDGQLSVTLPLVELGCIEAQYGSTEAVSVVGILYNSNGEQVLRNNYRGTTLTLSSVPDGNYTLVTMQASENFNSILSLSGLASVGLVAGSDYISSNVSVESGYISRVNIDNVPALNQNLLSYTSNNTHFTTNKTSLTIGSFVTLIANLEFKKAYKAKVQNVKLIIDLPQGCDFVDNSLLLNNTYTSFSRYGNQIAIELPNEGGNVKFCAIPSISCTFMPSASVIFTYDGKTITEPIGAATFEAKNLAIRVPSVAADSTVMLSGECPIGSSVKIFDNGELIGTTTARGYSWAANCILPNAYNFSQHEIYAIATTTLDVELMSETAICICDKSAIKVNKVTMYYYPDKQLVYDFLNNSNSDLHYSYLPDHPITFTIDFTTNDTTRINNVVLYVKTSAGTWDHPLNAQFNENLSCWIASKVFPSSSMPINVAVSYDSNTQSLLSAEVYDASINFYKDEQAEFNQEMADIDNIINNISTAWSNDDYDEGSVAAQRSELYTRLGITIEDNPPTTYTDEEMEAIYEECENALNDSLGLDSNKFLQQSFEEINAMTEGFTIGHCSGLTETQLLNEGYEKMVKDDGTCIYIFADETTMKIADLLNDILYDFDLQADNPMFAPMIELTKEDDFESKINSFCAKLESLSSKALDVLNTIADAADDLMLKIIQRNFKVAAHLNLCEQQIKYLKSLEHLTFDQKLRLYKYRLFWEKYTREWVINDKIFNFLNKLETKSLRIGKIKIKGLTGIGKVVGKVCAGFDIVMQILSAIEDEKKVIDVYRLIPNPCTYDQDEANSIRIDVISDGINAGRYYVAQIIADIFALSGASVGIIGALPSSGTSLSITATSFGVALASLAASYVWDFVFDKILNRRVTAIKQLKCYQEDPNQPAISPDWNYSNCPDVTPTVDPSGFVYEAVESNRLQGVTATIYYKETVEDMYGNPKEQEVKWDAEEYAQKNPLFTDENGMYQWDVPQGLWQVKFNKSGYEPTQSEWLPVPPPQLDVNIGMTQLRQPEVEMVHAYNDGVELTFDKYMRPATLTTDNIYVSQDGIDLNGNIQLLNNEQAGDETFASKVRFIPDSEIQNKPVTLMVKSAVESYAGVQMNSDFTQTFDIEQRVHVIALDTLVNVGYGEQREVQVQALPANIAGGKTLHVQSSQPIIADLEQETLTLDKHGKANITVNGNLPGATILTLSVDGFDLISKAKVQVVDEASLVTAKPIASVVNGKVFNEQLTITLTCETPNAIIYYTTDGTCPCDVDDRIKYEGPITISKTTTLKAIAIAPNRYESDIATYYYFDSNDVSSISTVETDMPFRITPTIVTDGFTVSGLSNPCDVRIYTINGNEVLHKTHVHNNEYVSMSNLSNGIYIVVVTVDGRPYAKRVMKKG